MTAGEVGRTIGTDRGGNQVGVAEAVVDTTEEGSQATLRRRGAGSRDLVDQGRLGVRQPGTREVVREDAVHCGSGNTLAEAPFLDGLTKHGIKHMIVVDGEVVGCGVLPGEAAVELHLLRNLVVVVVLRSVQVVEHFVAAGRRNGHPVTELGLELEVLDGLDYYNTLKYYLNNFEVIINNKKARQPRK
mgnify:CR=1 FL=1